jgi:uncharacterized membrane-anchored protein
MLKNLLTTLILLASGAVFAEEQGTPRMTAEQFEASVSYQSGQIKLPGGIATLNLPPSFRYLNPADTERVLVEGWGNPRGQKSLGMIVPAKTGLMTPAGWGVIVTYDPDGHVKDDDADAIKYDALLKEMQEGTEANNEERKKQGYAPMHLVGWAEQPRYDKASHKLYWAKELNTAGDTGNGLNYNIRVLGREGVLVLNAVAGMDQIDTIRSEMKQVVAFTEFTPGNTYADFNSTTDKMADYGIAALVAGGVAAKMGLFGKLFALLLVFKKFLIIGVGALGMGLLKLLGRKKQDKVSLEK